jgi:hypothetical protein
MTIKAFFIFFASVQTTPLIRKLANKKRTNKVAMKFDKPERHGGE